MKTLGWRRAAFVGFLGLSATLCSAKGESMWTSLRITSASGQVTHLTGPLRTGSIMPPANYGNIVLFPGDQLHVLTHRWGIPEMPSSFSMSRNGVNVVSGFWFEIPAAQDASTPGSYAGSCNADPGEVFSFTVVAGAMVPAALQAKLSVTLPGVPLVQGYYMRYDLALQQLIPCGEPYTSLGFAPSSAGSEMVDGCEALFLAKHIVDWIHVELRNDADPSIIVASRNGLLLPDGTITDIDGASPLSFTAVPGNYRVAIAHRNHLGVVTDQAFAFRGAASRISFTGGVMISMGVIVPSPTCAGLACAPIPGNTSLTAVPQRISYTGTSNDRDPILVRVGGSVPTNVATGYYTEDVNLDGVVKYMGENNDRDLILQAIGGSEPTNVVYGQTP